MHRVWGGGENTNSRCLERIKEAIELCLEVQEQEKEPLEFIGVQRVPEDV